MDLSLIDEDIFYIKSWMLLNFPIRIPDSKQSLMNETYQIRLARENELYKLNAIEEAASKLFEKTKFVLKADQYTLSITK